MKKLNTKLSLVLLGSLVASSLLTGFLVLQSQTEVLTRQLEYDGKTLAKTLSDMAAELSIAEEWSRIGDMMQNAVQGNRQVVFTHVHDDAGRLRASYPPLDETAAVPPPSPNLRVLENPILVAIDDLPTEVRGLVKVGLNNDRLQELTASSLSKMITGTIITFSLLAVVLWLSLRRQVILPLHELDHHVAIISTGDLTRPITTTRKDEMGRLAIGLERMRTSLQESYRRIEEQVIALKEMDRLKDDFLANTSHELKTPLNGIIGLAESLQVGSYGELTKEQHETVEMMISCASRLWKMTESILKFSRLHREDSQDEGAAQLHCLADHLQEALVDLRSNTEKAGVRLLVSVPKELEVVYPRSELEQVIRIFVDNASKYASGGMVQILAQKWDGGVQKGFQIAVRDNGPGIPAHLHEKIFEPFVQGEGHETRQHGGVGLGLAIAAKLVRRMGATLLLDSDVGRGACFTLLIPEGPVVCQDLKTQAFRPWPALANSLRVQLEKEVVTEPITTTAPRVEHHLEAAHVLVVDDESVNREVVWQALRDEFRVTRVADGATALEVLRTQGVDLLLLDIMMPGMSGYEVLQAMRQGGLLEKVPVIVLSAKASREAVVKGLEQGASDYLGKPFHRAELLCRVRVHLQIKKQRDQLESEVEAKTKAFQVADQASKIKTQFLANMSHEIRTPLNGILGFLELCMASEPTKEQSEYLGLVEERTRALLSIVGDILDVAKIESRQVSIQRSALAPAELVRKLAQEFTPQTAKKNLRLQVSCDNTCYQDFEADWPKLEHVVRNLLDNAIKFTRQGQVSLEALIQSKGADKGSLRFRVTDTGVGIAGTKREEIFQPFTQVDGSSTREFGGTGLGLAIARSLARMMGGDITVESTPGQGSTFTVTVPAVRQAATSAVETPELEAIAV